MRYLTIEDYCERYNVKQRTVYYQLQRGLLNSTKITGKKYIIVETPETEAVKLNEISSTVVVANKKQEYKERIKTIAIMIRNNGRSEKTENMISDIIKEIKILKERGIEIKGYGQRNIQIMIKKYLNGATELKRKTREDKFKPRVKLVKERPEIYELAIDIISDFYLKDPLHSLRNAIDRTRYECEKREDLWEVRALNFYTLRKWLTDEFKASGMKTISDYINHRNIWRKRLGYVKGAFTHDIGFRDVYAFDDRKTDVDGAFDFNKETGKLEKKKVYMWSCVDAHTMEILGFKMQAKAFCEDDLLMLMMQVFKQYGLPNHKIIYDNGLMAGERCSQFFNRLELEAVGVCAEAQKAYSPTDKATMERVHGFMKMETDIYRKNFVGSNHTDESRHEGVTLSPENTLHLIEEEVKRYEAYFAGYYLDRPRDLGIPNLDYLKDNTGRMSIRSVRDHYSMHHKVRVISDKQLCYAYMKYDIIKNFENYYIKFKKELYLPAEPLSPCFSEPTYRYFVAYNPNNLNSIYLYAAQDIIDKIYGVMYEKNTLICRLDSLAHLSSDEKKAKVAIYNKKIKKHTLQLANAYRSRLATEHNIANVIVDENAEIVNVAREQECAIANMINNAVPEYKIREVLETETQQVDEQEAFSEDTIKTLGDIHIEY